MGVILQLFPMRMKKQMSKERKTSHDVAKEASKQLRDPKSTPSEKKVAGSALSQAAPKKKK